MRYRLGQVLLLLFTIACCTAAIRAGTIKSAQSTGLKVSISKVVVLQDRITIQLVATNETNARIYIVDAEQDRSQYGLLASGTTLQTFTVIGIEQCNQDVAGCENDPRYNNLAQYSYIEPGGSLVFGLRYDDNSPPNLDDTISFSVALMAKFAKPNGDPSQVGPAKSVRFSFPFTPLKY